MLTSAGFNRRMRKTARPVVWKGCGVQLPAAPSNRIGKLAEDGSLADFSGETGPNGECQFKAVSAYGK